MTNLKQAQQDPKAMKEFFAEHEGDQIESSDFDKVLGSMTPVRGKHSTIQATSSKDDYGDYT